jgi:uncharacterized membrane protein
MKFQIVMLGFLVGGISFSCSNEDIDPATCNGTTFSFATDVKPIIDSKCAISGCHGTGSGNGPGALTSYAAISQSKNQISAAVSSGIMPKGSSLTSDQKNKILCWIQSGAMNN